MSDFPKELQGALDAARKMGWRPQKQQHGKHPTWVFRIPDSGGFDILIERRQSEISPEEIATIALAHGEVADLAAEIAKAKRDWFARSFQEPATTPKPVIDDCMALDTPVGARIRFRASGGYPMELERAKQVLSEFETYKVLDMAVGGFSSRVRIKEGWFNTVMFANLPEPEDTPEP